MNLKSREGPGDEVVYLFAFYRSWIVENTAFSSKDNEIYAEVKEENKNEETYEQQESDNPLYETVGGDAVFNPI